MKVRIDLEIDMNTGTYDARFHNLTKPGEDIDVPRLATLVHRVIDNVAMKTHQENEDADNDDRLHRGAPQWAKNEIN